MKKLLREFLFFELSLLAVARILPGLRYADDALVLLKAGLVLTLSHLILKPVLNLIALPINILTLGLFSLIINGLLLYLATLFVTGFSVSGFHFPALNLYLINVNSFYVPVVLSFLIVAFFLSLAKSFLNWLCSR